MGKDFNSFFNSFFIFFFFFDTVVYDHLMFEGNGRCDFAGAV